MFQTREAKTLGLEEPRRLQALTLNAVTLLTGLALLAGCAGGATPVNGKPETVRSHVYALPVDNVLAQTRTLVEEKGFRVKKVGNVLLTNWLGSETSSLVAYRVYGERIDAGLSSLRVERLVASTMVNFNTDHPLTLACSDCPPPATNPHFAANSVDESAVGTAPGTTNNWSDIATRAQMVVTQRQRDAALEKEFQEAIDPTTLAATEPAVPLTGLAEAGASVTPGATARASPVTRTSTTAGVASTSAPPKASLAGVWEGIFYFRGNIVGSYAGEVTVAVDDGSIEVSDFCPESGGTLTAKAKASGILASWQGDLACPPISVQGCPDTVIRYNFANAMLMGSTLRLLAAGTVEAPAACGESGGALSVTFEATKAHYLYLTVNRTNERTTCTWPIDWEDLASTGSLPMPEPPMTVNAFLGIIRANGGREADVEKLLRTCRHHVALHGVAVYMLMATTGPRKTGLH